MTMALTQPRGGSKTQVVEQTLYRQPMQSMTQRGGTNIMYDKRVVRGSMYSQQVLPLAAQAQLALAQQEADRQRRRIAAERKKRRDIEDDRVATPPPVDGRRHQELQTETYLEELADAPKEAAAETQTDALMDRPATPVYVAAKSGRDAETQVADGELFDFDAEIEPLLEVIVGKTVEQAILEVMQEEELEALRQQQVVFEQRRMEELVETQRLAAAERRREEEKERRKQQERARVAEERATRAKLAARAFARSFLGTLEQRVFARLEDDGLFHDAIAREVETTFMPWLYTAVDASVARAARSHVLVDDLIRAALAKAAGP